MVVVRLLFFWFGMLTMHSSQIVINASCVSVSASYVYSTYLLKVYFVLAWVVGCRSIHNARSRTHGVLLMT